MSVKMGENMKRWMEKRKSALVLDIIQGKTTVAEASRACGLSRVEGGTWGDNGKWRMENVLSPGNGTPPTFNAYWTGGLPREIHPHPP